MSIASNLRSQPVPRQKTLAEKIQDHIDVMEGLMRVAARQTRSHDATFGLLSSLEQQGLELRKMARG